MTNMKTKINNKLIRSFVSCYDPIEIGIPDNESLSVKDWIKKYRNIVKEKQDVIWLICRNDFLSDRDLRLFAVWCARKALKLVKNPDERSVNACNIAERYANGQATDEELAAARYAANAATITVAMYATEAIEYATNATYAAARSATYTAEYATEAYTYAAARTAARAAIHTVTKTYVAQINKLLTYF